MTCSNFLKTVLKTAQSSTDKNTPILLFAEAQSVTDTLRGAYDALLDH